MLRNAWLAALACFVLVYIIPLGARPFIIPDEVRYAEIAREMAESGDWVVPRLNGIRYFEKPPLGYWLTALSMKTFGYNAFSARLPSALSVAVSSFLLSLLLISSGRPP